MLDEHTAALDPKTAHKVLELTTQIVEKDNLTTIMITHNMKDALAIGNRLIMMNEGKIIYDVSGEEKKKLTTADLLEKFKITSGSELDNDRMLLSSMNKAKNLRIPRKNFQGILFLMQNYFMYPMSLPSKTRVEYSPAIRLVILIS